MNNFSITCYDEKVDYKAELFDEVLYQYVCDYVNSEGNEQNRYLNVLFGLISQQEVIIDNNGEILPEINEANYQKIDEYARKLYYKKHLMDYSDLLMFTYETIDEIYPSFPTEKKNYLMQDVVDNAIRIGENIQSEYGCNNYCEVIDSDFRSGDPTLLFVEKPFITALVQDSETLRQTFNYDYSIKDSIEEYEKDLLEDR